MSNDKNCQSTVSQIKRNSAGAYLRPLGKPIPAALSIVVHSACDGLSQVPGSFGKLLLANAPGEPVRAAAFEEYRRSDRRPVRTRGPPTERACGALDRPGGPSYTETERARGALDRPGGPSYTETECARGALDLPGGPSYTETERACGAWTGREARPTMGTILIL